jgi:hypothetical protein
MERAGSSFAKWTAAQAHLTTEEMVVAAWPAAVGRRLAGRTRAKGLVRRRLVIEVEDAVWQRNLHMLRHQILAKLSDLLGENAPGDLEFRIGIPRRPPQREVSASLLAPGEFRDEADAISDPVLSRIYRISRRKAGA